MKGEAKVTRAEEQKKEFERKIAARKAVKEERGEEHKRRKTARVNEPEDLQAAPMEEDAQEPARRKRPVRGDAEEGAGAAEAEDARMGGGEGDSDNMIDVEDIRDQGGKKLRISGWKPRGWRRRKL